MSEVALPMLGPWIDPMACLHHQQKQFGVRPVLFFGPVRIGTRNCNDPAPAKVALPAEQVMSHEGDLLGRPARRDQERHDFLNHLGDGRS